MQVLAPKEKVAENKVTKWAIANGWLAEKVKFATSGYPDHIYFGFGKTILIEYKRHKQVPRGLQEYRINELRKRGIEVYWTTSHRFGIAILAAAQLSSQCDQNAAQSGQRRSVP
jgi:hypothetical protein